MGLPPTLSRMLSKSFSSSSSPTLGYIFTNSAFPIVQLLDISELAMVMMDRFDITDGPLCKSRPELGGVGVWSKKDMLPRSTCGISISMLGGRFGAGWLCLRRSCTVFEAPVSLYGELDLLLDFRSTSAVCAFCSWKGSDVILRR